MHNSWIFCIIFTFTLALMVFHNAEAAEPISLSSDNDIYYNGDYIVIFGSVSTIFENVPITIQIYYDANLVDVAQVPVAKDGTFAKSFSATGPQWKNEGTYLVRAFYTSTQISEIPFEFFSQVIDKSSAAFHVDIPNSGTFDVGYTIRGGEVKNITMNQEHYSILVETTMNSNGNLILKLPTESFDAKTNGANTVFIILISKENSGSGDFAQAEYEEIATGDNYRTIRIPLETGDQFVEVIGTYVIPEFGSMVIIILVVAISSIIIISKSRLSVRYN